MAPTTEAPPLQLADLWSLLRRRRGAAIASAALVILLVLVLPGFLLPALYRAEASLTLENGAKPVNFQADANAVVSDQLVNTQRELLTSKPVLEHALAMGGLLGNPAYARAGDGVAVLQRRLRTGVIKNSWVITISLDDEDPARAEAGLQSVLDAFLAQQSTRLRAHGAEDLAFLDQQLAAATAKLDTAREAERAFRSRHSIASIDPDRNHITARILSLAELQASLDERTAGSGALVRQIEAVDAVAEGRQRDLGYLRINELATSPTIVALRQDLLRLEGQEAELSAMYLDKHPKLIEARQHISAKHGQLQEAILASRATILANHQRLVDQRTALVASQTDLQAELNDYREALIRLQQLALASQAEQQVCNELMNRRAELATLSDYQDRRMSVSARPRSAAMPRTLGTGPLLGLALLAGVAAAVVGAAMADVLDPSIRHAQQVAAVTRLRSLGQLPATQHLAPLSATGPNDPADLAEAVRALWASLRYALGPATGGRILIVTSASPGDGRTSLTARLASGAAMAGSRVLAVDGDLRHGDLCAQFGMPSTRGLTQLLSGEPDIAPLATGLPNLDLMPAGDLPANPGELIHSHCLAEWLTQCRESYDLIIVDSPAFQACADALVLADQADGILLAARAGGTTRSALADTCARLSPMQSRLLGTVTVGGV